MRCERCGLDNSRCIDSREGKIRDTRRRRYKCLSCGHRWTTVELKVRDRHLKKIIEDEGYVEAAITKTLDMSEELKRILEAMRSPRSGELPEEEPEDGQQES